MTKGDQLKINNIRITCVFSYEIILCKIILGSMTQTKILGFQTKLAYNNIVNNLGMPKPALCGKT